MDNEDFEADWIGTVRGNLEEKSRHPLIPRISANACMYCVSPTETKTQSLGV